MFTDDDVWAEKLRSLCVHGKGSDKYDNIRIGMNSRLDTIQVAVLLQKRSFFEEEIAACNRVSKQYRETLRYREDTDNLRRHEIKLGSVHNLCKRCRRTG